jgi:hypothetical protein
MWIYDLAKIDTKKKKTSTHADDDGLITPLPWKELLGSLSGDIMQKVQLQWKVQPRKSTV